MNMLLTMLLPPRPLPFHPPLPPHPLLHMSGAGDTSELTVTWARQNTCWIQEASEVAAVVAPILQQALRDANKSLIEKILGMINSDQIFYGTRTIALNCNTQKHILRQALDLCSAENAEGGGSSLTPITHMCLSESQAAMSLIDDQRRTEIIESATHDLLWFMQKSRFDDSEKYYQFLQDDAWKQLHQHERLAVSFALRPNASGFSSKGRSHFSDGWESYDVEQLDAYVDKRVTLSIKLASQMSAIFRGKSDDYTVNVTGPFSLAISCILLTARADRPTVTYRSWLNGAEVNADTAEKCSRAASLVLQVLGETLQNLGNQNVSTIVRSFKDKFLEPASTLISVLGPRAEKALKTLMNADELERVIIEVELNRNKDLLDRCKALSKYERIGSSPSLADTILRQDYELNFCNALTCIKMIYQSPSVAANGEENAAEVSCWAK